MFDAVRQINSIADGKEQINLTDLDQLKKIFHTFTFEVLGLHEEEKQDNNSGKTSELIELLLNMRVEAKTNKDWSMCDRIRDELKNMGILVKDKKDGFEWEIE
ncbi:CysS/YqeB C-terminal domain-containing protein [Candidatus Venteria ishoeyi]|uniref:Cysteine--tRNA ligase n=1 Tax=Candidatus Venteria ishoeyi TaxID=1899563 RepID=A0A1H6F505_9GAMM|nr:hypothetical protein [Candidatus Venteria ishoeyi]SEH05220.1 Cysteine--tRNA ligase [Candidatus Venteria ishoeyi]